MLRTATKTIISQMVATIVVAGAVYVMNHAADLGLPAWLGTLLGGIASACTHRIKNGR